MYILLSAEVPDLDIAVVATRDNLVFAEGETRYRSTMADERSCALTLFANPHLYHNGIIIGTATRVGDKCTQTLIVRS
jgi:hypothetical protein